MLYDKVGYYLAIIAFIFGIVAALFDSLFWAIFLCIVYVIGLIWGTQLICLIRTTSANNNEKLVNTVIESCGVCGNNQCKRHRKSANSNPTAKVPKGFDNALERLLETILQTYVCTWYSSLSTNDAFVQQLRLAIATAATNITSRLFRADISHIVFNHLIPLGVHHARDWQELSKRAKNSGGSPTDYIADYLGSKIHPAAYSREAELNYLRGLAATLLPHLLPATHVSTNNQVILREVLANWVLLPAIDALADPDNLNMLISLCIHYDGKLPETDDTMFVPLLQTWISTPQSGQNISNTLKPSLEEVLNDPELLYMFMQHIKDSGLVNLLQFCLDIDDLSKRMLNPEITPETEETLYNDAQNIYTTYLDPDSADFLNLPMYISTGMKQILDLGPEKIQELRTSRPLYEAHQEAHTLLENTWLPSFHHTYQVYRFLCGTPVINTSVKPSSQQRMNCNNSNNDDATTTTSTKSRSNSVRSGTSCAGISAGVGARLSSQLSKIRGVLKASAVDGAPFHPQQIFQGEEANARSGTTTSSTVAQRDMSAWRVSIPQVDGGGAQPLYSVAVHSVAEDKSWSVLRRDQDFYALRARLSEFHGDKELNDSPLPTRKNPHPSLPANRQRYQDFLQKLLVKPTLRSSELLHAFLTVPNLKPYFTNYSTPDIGVLYQSMTHKLRKEKGQHLDKFMSTFMASTDIKYDQPDLGIEIVGEHNFQESHGKGQDLLAYAAFGNNLNLDPRIQNFPYIVNKMQHTKGACFCIVEAIDSLLDVPPTASRGFWVLASTLRPSADPFVNRWFYELIITLLSGGRAAIVVKLLHSTIFDTESDEDATSSKQKAEEHYKMAKSGLYNLRPWWFIGLHSSWCKFIDSLLEPIQCGPFNKHLAYVLVDQLLVNLFPELS